MFYSLKPYLIALHAFVILFLSGCTNPSSTICVNGQRRPTKVELGIDAVADPDDHYPLWALKGASKVTFEWEQHAPLEVAAKEVYAYGTNQGRDIRAFSVHTHPMTKTAAITFIQKAGAQLGAPAADISNIISYVTDKTKDTRYLNLKDRENNYFSLGILKSFEPNAPIIIKVEFVWADDTPVTSAQQKSRP